MSKKKITVLDIVLARLNCDSVLLEESEWNERQKAERLLLDQARRRLVMGPEAGVPEPNVKAIHQLLERYNHV